MKSNVDTKSYKEYMDEENKALEVLYSKYKSKIEYFVFNIVKDHHKAEDITQEIFIEVMQHKIKMDNNFKYNIFLLAKEKALNQLNLEEKNSNISEKYLLNNNEMIEEDVLETITNKETKEELLKAINRLDDKYRNVLYLVKIEELPYKEVAEILGISIQNVKNLVHRGKKELKKKLLGNRFESMAKATKILIIVVFTSVALTGIAYATAQIIKMFKNSNVTFNPTYERTIDANSTNNIWIGTFELAWKELAEKLGKNGKIELEENVQIADDLNHSTFSKEMLSEDDYEINITENSENGYDISATLNKSLNFIHPFDNFSSNMKTFNFENEEDIIEEFKCFGIGNTSSEELNENVEVLFYNNENEFAVTLKTQEGDEIILYRTDEQKSFKEYYSDINEKSRKYTGEKEFKQDDELLIPYISVNGLISYNELLGKTIKNKNAYINEAIQNVNFNLNENGCNVYSEAKEVTKSIIDKKRNFKFTNKFILYMKEKNMSMPYFVLKIDNIDILMSKYENNEFQIIDYTTIDPQKYAVEEKTYKFFEDQFFEYYYKSLKTKYVQVFYKEGKFRVETVEEALKNRRITIDLLDKYGIEYIKKKK